MNGSPKAEGLLALVIGLMIVGCSGGVPTPQIIYVTPSPPMAGGVEVTPQPPAEATAAPELTVEPTEASSASVEVVNIHLVRWIDAIKNARVQLIAEVKNTGSGWADLYVDSDYTLFAEDGSVTTTGTFYYGFPRYLGPGQTGYLLDETSENGGAATDFAKVEFTPQFNDVDGPGDVLVISNTKIKSGYFGDGVDVTGVVKNPGGVPISTAVVAAILLDLGGVPIGYNWTLVDDVGAGNTKGFVLSGGRDLKLSTVKKAIIYGYALDF